MFLTVSPVVAPWSNESTGRTEKADGRGIFYPIGRPEKRENR